MFGVGKYVRDINRSAKCVKASLQELIEAIWHNKIKREIPQALIIPLKIEKAS
jgi:hypothetical protein